MNELPSDINPGIIRTVQWLRSHGFETCDSGDGVTHMAECDRPYPYVSIRVAPEGMVARTIALKELLAKARIVVVPQAWAFDQGGLPNAPFIQATYDPADGIAIIDLRGVSDARLPAVLP